jgi:hypothetical protein
MAVDVAPGENPRRLNQYDVFISYSWDDKSLAESIQRGLHRIARSQPGRRWFTDGGPHRPG